MQDWNDQAARSVAWDASLLGDASSSFVASNRSASLAPENSSDFLFVLGSRSPRRRQLLNDSNYRFFVLPSDDGVEERETPGDDPREFVDRLAFVKARDVARKIRTNAEIRGEITRALSSKQTNAPFVVISCDSIAVCDGEFLGKPIDIVDAERMLRKLSGSTHCVHTGLCVWKLDDEPQNDQIVRRVETSVLLMDSLSEERLKGYLASGLWEGKAGAFGYQDGNDWLQLISGSESNVVGLPLEALRAVVEELRPTTL